LPRFFDDLGVAARAGATPLLVFGAGAGAAVGEVEVVDTGAPVDAQAQGAVEGLIVSFIIL